MKKVFKPLACGLLTAVLLCGTGCGLIGGGGKGNVQVFNGNTG